MDKIQSLRNLTVKLETSGTATLIENTKLYKGGYAFVGLRAFVPITQNREEGLTTLCTVHGVITDSFGNRKQLGRRFYNMKFVQTVERGGFGFLLFERLIPKALTDTAGELELVFNYSEITAEGKLSSRLATNTLRTFVDEGGEADGEIDIDLKSQEVAQINANTITIERLIDDVENLVKPPDVSETNRVGVVGVTITPEGNLKFVNLKGEKGERGEQGQTGVGMQGPTGEKGPRGANIHPYYKTLSISSTNVFHSDLPDHADLGDFIIDQSGNMSILKIRLMSSFIAEFCANIQGLQGQQGIQGERGIQGLLGPQGNQGPSGPQGKPFTIAKIYPSISAMNSSYSDSSVSTGSFVLINTGNVSDADNAKLYIKGVSRFEFLTDLSGTTGLQGPQGVTGMQGIQGGRGMQGEQGETGVQGEQGKIGVQGERGIPGIFEKHKRTVETTSWVSDTSFQNYGFRAPIPVVGVTLDNMCDVVFGLVESNSSNFASTTDTYVGGCYIYAKAKPTANIYVVVIVL